MGLYQAKKYYRFLFAAGVGDDVRQEIAMAIHVYPDNLRERSLFLNRRLYALAKSCGFRKRHTNEPRLDGNWWHRPVISFEEANVRQ